MESCGGNGRREAIAGNHRTYGTYAELFTAVCRANVRLEDCSAAFCRSGVCDYGVGRYGIVFAKKRADV